MKLRVDHWVRTADGSIGRVRYVSEARNEAEVAIDNDPDNTLTLPLGELKRVPNPEGKLPPIEGMPEGERPRCPYCNKQLKPETEYYRQRRDPANPLSSFTGKVIRRVFTGWSGYSIVRGNAFDKFCTLRCARAFANAAWAAGYRVKR